jgi:two-component system, cell cycle response regulator
VVDQANDGYLIVGTGGKLMYANQSARLLLELPQATAEWREPLWMLVQRQFRCEPEKIWQHWFANEAEPPTHSIYLIRPETETAPALWLEVTVLAQEDRSGLEQLLHVRDVTAQLSTQRDTWSFHAMIMHKLNTPLQTLLGGLELLVPDSINEMSRTEISLMARLAQAGALRLSNAIADVLRYLRTPVLARGDEGLALHQMPELIAQLSADLGVTVKLLIKLNLDERKLHLSRRAIESLLWELLRNAQKFHPQKQPLVEIALAADQPDLLELSVADNGVSLAPEQIAKVWLPYYQAEKHFTGEMPGMGLGLAMVAVLVWGVGGRCRFRNRDNGPGVVVELSLPLRQA